MPVDGFIIFTKNIVEKISKMVDKKESDNLNVSIKMWIDHH